MPQLFRRHLHEHVHACAVHLEVHALQRASKHGVTRLLMPACLPYCHPCAQGKAKAYKSAAQGALFMMNNVHYMVRQQQREIENRGTFEGTFEREKGQVCTRSLWQG